MVHDGITYNRDFEYPASIHAGSLEEPPYHAPQLGTDRRLHSRGPVLGDCESNPAHNVRSEPALVVQTCLDREHIPALQINELCRESRGAEIDCYAITVFRGKLEATLVRQDLDFPLGEF